MVLVIASRGGRAAFATGEQDAEFLKQSAKPLAPHRRADRRRPSPGAGAREQVDQAEVLRQSRTRARVGRMLSFLDIVLCALRRKAGARANRTTADEVGLLR